jgi:choice-of-anchor C domain-containing protein
MKFLKTLFTMAALSVASIATAANVNLIQNGSFEQGIDPNASGIGFTTLGSGGYFDDTTSLVGWSVGSTGKGRFGNVDYIGDYWQAATGARSLDLNGTAPGAIGQRLNGLTPGQTYHVSFAISANPDSKRNTRYGTVSFNADNEAFVYRFSDQATPNSRENMNWIRTGYDFVATKNTAWLTFISGGNGAFGPALDDVRVYSGAGMVPEPQTWALLVIGFGLVGFQMRGKQKAVPA